MYVLMVVENVYDISNMLHIGVYETGDIIERVSANYTCQYLVLILFKITFSKYLSINYRIKYTV